MSFDLALALTRLLFDLYVVFVCVCHWLYFSFQVSLLGGSNPPSLSNSVLFFHYVFNLSLSLYNDENFLSFIGACSCCVVSYPKVPSLLFVLPADPELFFLPCGVHQSGVGLFIFFGEHL